MIENFVFLSALALGVMLLASVCYIYVKNQSFGLGGSCLSGMGVILVGMSVWKNINFSMDATGIKAQLEQVQSVAKSAEHAASKAQAEAQTSSQAVSQLQSRLDVMLVQEKLTEAGMYKGPPDGVLGAMTKSTLMRYQESKGLPPTGLIDEPTKRVMGISSP
jgi:hypothetical protein